MREVPRKKSPRAPSISLEEALERVQKVYEKERLDAVPIDVVAQDIGYKNANNGAALSVLASLRYYGLMDRPEEGQMAINRSYEEYKFAPDEAMRQSALTHWLKSPPVFADLIDRYASGLPSDPTLRYDLIKRGFTPVSAESVISVFRKSADFAGYFENPHLREEVTTNGQETASVTSDELSLPAPAQSANTKEDEPQFNATAGSGAFDKIPVRLPGGRRAWLAIPTPFYSSDKARLKAQIDLLLTEDEQE